MARIGISITKSCSYRQGVQEFSNVYYFDGLLGTPSQAEADNLIDEMANKEKTFHSAAVTFVRGRLWSQTGSQSTNEMLSQKNLTGVGARTADGNVDRERAFMFYLRAGNDSRGKPVYLRKWYHSLGAFYSGQTFATNAYAQTSPLSTTDRNNMVSQMQNIGSIGAGATLGTLCAKSGRQPTAGAQWIAHPWIEHHQLGDQWRAQ